LSKVKGTDVSDLTVMILDRSRHDEIVNEVRKAGSRIRFITDGDVAGAIAAAREGSGVDLLMGIGGTPEGVTAAAAIKCLDGFMQGRLWPRNEEERRAAVEAGYDVDKVLSLDDLVSGEDVFFAATGITGGNLLDGVRYRGESAITHSISMRSRSGTIRMIDAMHRRRKLKRYSKILY
jgi:fructose-1,6-bisphosphatase II